MRANEARETDEIDCFRIVPEHHDPVEPVYGSGLPPGYLLDGRFAIGEPLSRSGMAVIYKATDKSDHDRPVAIKVPHLGHESSPNFYQRFLREEEIGHLLDHPFILKFLQVGRKSRPYIVTEYLSGCTLAHLLQAMHPLTEKDALKIAGLVCDALDHLHSRGVVHRDLKPSNIMICPDRTIRIIDFGIASGGAARHAVTNMFTPTIGTPDYMAPEQVSAKPTDARTDIYSLGAVLYEMLTGRLPFLHENPWVAMTNRVTGDPPAPRSINPAISPQAEEIVLRAMRREPAERYQTAAEFKAALTSPMTVEVTGLSRRLEKPRWKLGMRETPVVAGVLIGVSFLLFQVFAFILLYEYLKRK